MQLGEAGHDTTQQRSKLRGLRGRRMPGDTAAAATSAGARASDSARAADEITATVVDAAGRTLGVLTLVDAEQGIAVSGTLRGLAPGRHGMHVHMTGRCDPPDT